MDTITQLCNLLDEKRDLFEQYEAATLALLSCEADAVGDYITQRAGLANQIEDLNEQLGRLCDGRADRQVMLDAASARVDFANVPSEYQCVYYAGQAVRSVTGRIATSEQQAVERLEALRADALEHVRQNQNVAKIHKYMTDLNAHAGETNLKDSKV